MLRGGSSSEYDLSLLSGAAVMNALPEDRFETRDIFIDKQGTWHWRGLPVLPARALAQLDTVVSALHGGEGEDGTVHRILERAGVPYTGSRAHPSSIALNKVRARETFKAHGIRVPQGMHFFADVGASVHDMAKAAFASFGPPYVVKPWQEGAGEGVRIADTIRDLPYVLGDVLSAHRGAVVEEFVRGKEVTVGVIEDFRGSELYALPPAEIVLPQGFRTMQPVVHQLRLMDHIVPSTLSREQKDALEDTARRAHRALGLSHYSRADLIITPRAVYLLEVNALPCLYEGSSFHDMLGAVGASLEEFLSHVISLARR